VGESTSVLQQIFCPVILPQWLLNPAYTDKFGEKKWRLQFLWRSRWYILKTIVIWEQLVQTGKCIFWTWFQILCSNSNFYKSKM